MIKLKDLLNEQLPGQPAPAAPQPAAKAPAEQPAPADVPPEVEPQSVAPQQPDGSEYDFTKDFKEFEDSVNKAKSDAKKKFLDKMNGAVVGKKVTVNASRGYGQPQKDYTIDKIAKASVDWYYNKNVVVLSDENGKEYFLTPGVNIKVESPAATSSEEQPSENPEEQPTQSAPKEVPNKSEEPGTPPAQPEPAAAAPTPAPETPSTAVVAAKKSAPGGEPTVPSPVTPEEEPEELEKEKQPMSESLKKLFREVSENRKLNLDQFVKNANNSGYELHIPKSLLPNFNRKDFELEYRSFINEWTGDISNFDGKLLNVESVGRFYIFSFNKH